MKRTDFQVLERAQVLLREAGVIWIVWTSTDVEMMVESKLAQVGLSVPVNEVMELINLTHLSNDDNDESIWLAIEDAIYTIVDAVHHNDRE